MTMTRRSVLKSVALSTVATMSRRLPAQLTESSLATDPMRPQFHLLPYHNWMNDPNGPIYFNGQYHMFFQYNPQAAVWGNMSWYHAVSQDMLHWTSLPLALVPDSGGPDAAGVFSGSAIATEDHGKKRVYAVYTGVVKDKAQETIRNEGLRESQCLAWSDDPLLRQWTKLRTPIIAAPPAGLEVTGFRDPSVWREGSWFYMTVGSGIAGSGGCVLLYRSRDLRSWEYLHLLANGTWDGAYTSNPVADGEMWECPEFFALDGGHVLIYSTQGKVSWQSGDYDSKAMRFTSRKSGLLDFDAFYAPKTQLDAQGRRILWGWIPERRSEEAMRAAGWSGMMSLPRFLTLDSDGTLRMTALPESSRLRGVAIDVENGRGILPAATGEFLFEIKAGQPGTLELSSPETKLLSVKYIPENNTIALDEHIVHLRPDDIPSIHGFVDGSVIELFAAGRSAYTKRFYYAGHEGPAITCVGLGYVSRLSLWNVNAISSNRLTDQPSIEASTEAITLAANCDQYVGDNWLT